MKLLRFSLLLLLLWPGQAAAHDLGAECRLRQGQVEVTAYFDSNAPAGHARVTVTDTSGGTVAQGKTDVQGRWQFPAPPAGQYTVQINAGAGHRVNIAITLPASPPVGDLQLGKAGMEGDHDHEVPISTGPSRGDFTRFPWSGMLLGLAILGGLVGVLLLFARHRPEPPAR